MAIEPRRTVTGEHRRARPDDAEAAMAREGDRWRVAVSPAARTPGLTATFDPLGGLGPDEAV
ncbi:hypothetical protein AB0F88_35630 [Streptosporangium sp. NPDC023963]|uniref:hypothetical protein n=1 Tax=Streptosporangium sp. NPDC023963 TaxID=3155608 RepID=UPI0034333418